MLIAVPDDMPSGKFSQYISEYAAVAVNEQRVYGVPASISLAQGILESGGGTSKLAVTANNHFGIKCFGKDCVDGHCVAYCDDTPDDRFRMYRTAYGSWRSHSRVLSSKRYRSLHKYGTDYRKWAAGLLSLGYATDKDYARKIVSIIKRYRLYRYDGLCDATEVRSR